ncbi:hypothetical protein MMC07_005797 [Pseudocyphellaria aurata]|nr:hypothetical protein [Pseudocyphellaria aurata]
MSLTGVKPTTNALASLGQPKGLPLSLSPSTFRTMMGPDRRPRVTILAAMIASESGNFAQAWMERACVHIRPLASNHLNRPTPIDDRERVDRGAGERQTPDYCVTRRAESFSSVWSEALNWLNGLNGLKWHRNASSAGLGRVVCESSTLDMELFGNHCT